MSDWNYGAETSRTRKRYEHVETAHTTVVESTRRVDPSIWTDRAEFALDVWASVAHAQMQGCRGVPTIDAILMVTDPIGDDGLPLPDDELPRRVKVYRKEEIKILREDETGAQLRRWIVAWIEEYQELNRVSSTLDPQDASWLMHYTVAAWIKDLGSPTLTVPYLLAAYPKRGPYERGPSDFDASWLYGKLRPGRAASRLQLGFGAFHRAALRDLADWLSEFGVRKPKKHNRLTVNGKPVERKQPVRGRADYTFPSDREAREVAHEK